MFYKIFKLIFNKKSSFLKTSIISSLLIYSLSIYLINDADVFDKILRNLPGWMELDSDIDREIHDLILSRGFKYETHFVETNDGYILQLLRIINPYNKNHTKYRPVMLAHGFSCSGSVYLINNPGYLNSDGDYIEWDENNKQINGSETTTNTLGFTLSSMGYDVWLANFRGSLYSNKHKYLDNQNKEFWNFTLDDMINIDLPAMIDYVLENTNHTTLTYVGHSQGNIIALALLSDNQYYQKIMQPFIALSPTWYIEGVDSFLTKIQHIAPYLDKTSPFPSYNQRFFPRIFAKFCSNKYVKLFCVNVYHLSVGYQTTDIRLDRFPVYVFNVPTGTSTAVGLQHLQSLKNGVVSRFDHGHEKNLLIYKQPKPPVYNVSNINSKHLVFFQSINDQISPIKGNKLLEKHLPQPLLRNYVIDKPDFKHMSFVWSKYSGKLVNERILNLLQLYEKNEI